jgi:hypothetical protein
MGSEDRCLKCGASHDSGDDEMLDTEAAIVPQALFDALAELLGERSDSSEGGER